jgi:hypothetical protein
MIDVIVPGLVSSDLEAMTIPFQRVSFTNCRLILILYYVDESQWLPKGDKGFGNANLSTAAQECRGNILHSKLTNLMSINKSTYLLLFFLEAKE